MKNLSHSSAEGLVRDPLPDQLVKWLNSDSGRSAVINALSNYNEAFESLNEARKVKPEQLHEPITL